MLIDAFKTACKYMTKTKASDGIGGYVNTWTEGASFNAAIVKNSTIEAKIAEKQGVTEVYTVTVDSNVSLDYHDVFKRVSDGAIFRVTSNDIDSKPPSVATFSFNQVSAERWELA